MTPNPKDTLLAECARAACEVQHLHERRLFGLDHGRNRRLSRAGAA